MIYGIPNRPIYFYQKDIIVNHFLKWTSDETFSDRPECQIWECAFVLVKPWCMGELNIQLTPFPWNNCRNRILGMGSLVFIASSFSTCSWSIAHKPVWIVLALFVFFFSELGWKEHQVNCWDVGCDMFLISSTVAKNQSRKTCLWNGFLTFGYMWWFPKIGVPLNHPF